MGEGLLLCDIASSLMVREINVREYTSETNYRGISPTVIHLPTHKTYHIHRFCIDIE